MKKSKSNVSHMEKINMVSKPTNVLLNLFFVLICATCVYPMLLVIATSFNSEDAIKLYGFTVIPREFTIYAYEYILANANTILRAYGVTIFVTAIGTVLTVVVCGLYGYAISRHEFKYRKLLTFYMFFTMLFSGGTVPWYLICSRVLHITNTIWALILPMICSAWNIIILKTFFQTSVPDEIIESGRLDGASEMRIFFKIVCPISLPGLATIALFAMLGYWNDYYNPLMLTTDPDLQNLQLYLYNILKTASMLSTMAAGAGEAAVKQLPQESARMAICVVSVAPIVFAYPFFQRYFIQGLTVGAVKG